MCEIVSNKELKQEVAVIRINVKHFDKMRDIMRIAALGQKNGLNDDGKIKTEKDLRDVEKHLRKFITKIEKQKVISPQLQKVIKQLEKYWDRIFTPVIKTNIEGEIITIIPQRTNNTSEQFYRRLKQLLRRLHGNSKLNKDLVYLPEEIALIENLTNNRYVSNFLGNIDQLAIEFANIDIHDEKLPFEKKQLEMKMSPKIKSVLKNFKPMELIKMIK